MPISATSPKYHAFIATFATGGSAIQGSGPTREDALEEATRGLGSAEGLVVYETGSRLAAALALGDYELMTPFTTAEGRAELRLVSEVDEALADIVVAFAQGRRQWTGRHWDDADRVCPDTTDSQIVRLYRTSDRLDVTAWGIDEGDRGQPWRNAVRSAADALGTALEAADETAQEEACRALRALAASSDLHVAEAAAAAEEAARAALAAARADAVDEALEQAEEAARLERAYGDDPTWGPLLAAVRTWAAVRDE